MKYTSKYYEYGTLDWSLMSYVRTFLQITYNIVDLNENINSCKTNGVWRLGRHLTKYIDINIWKLAIVPTEETRKISVLININVVIIR